jgi:antitoxin component YwqK of YwqJK toxin-antitoxin module
MLTEYKTDRYHYFEDDRGRRQGEYKSWYANGQLWENCFYVDGKWHGECKWWKNGQIRRHCFYVNGEVYRDLLENPVTEEEKFLITLETGAKWLC